MMAYDALSIFSLGLLLRVRHTLNVDHLAAISTITIQAPAFRSCAIGAC